LLLDELFRPLFPPEIGLGTGEIISSTGEVSSEQDVVIYSQSMMPPVVYRGATGLFPIESVIYSIEVKSRLTKAELRKAHKSANKVSSFTYLSGLHDENDQPIRVPVPRLISTLFAFDSDLKGDEMQRYDSFRGPGRPEITAICVLGKGYWDWSDLHSKWIQWTAPYADSEAVFFVAHVLNTWQKLRDRRGTPRFGNYLT
jgi:hypothetical protein